MQAAGRRQAGDRVWEAVSRVGGLLTVQTLDLAPGNVAPADRTFGAVSRRRVLGSRLMLVDTRWLPGAMRMQECMVLVP